MLIGYQLAMNLKNPPSKIMIFGKPGSGKSTFALSLQDFLKIPLYHLDKIFFTSHWVERDYQEFLKIQESLVNKERWILDGNSIRSLETRYSRADWVIYFNYPTRLCYYRIFKRLLDKNPAIDDRAEGCCETVRLSLLSYVWSFEKRVSPQILSLKQRYPQTPFIEIKNNKDLEQLKKQWGMNQDSTP